MNIRLLVVGKTVEKYLCEGIAEYVKRLGRFVSFEIVTLADVRGSFTQDQIKEAEGRAILERVEPSHTLVLLDERGVQYSSEGFAAFLEDHTMRGCKSLIFVIGGAYGFSEAVYGRATGTVGLSKMTFSHQMVRLIFVEQLYRAYTITVGLPYHHK